MGIREQEVELFKLWNDTYHEIVPDGVVDEETYISSRTRVLYLLKEVNDVQDDWKPWDLREYIKKGERPQTWNNITRWTKGIGAFPEEITWSELSDITQQQRALTSSMYAVMNIKKTPGAASSADQVIIDFARKHQKLLSRQFDLYSPTITICCGRVTAHTLKEVILADKECTWKQTRRGIGYLVCGAGQVAISYFHPQTRMPANFLYYGLMDALKEVTIQESFQW